MKFYILGLILVLSLTGFSRFKLCSYKLSVKMISINKEPIKNAEFTFNDKDYMSDSNGVILIDVPYISGGCGNFRVRKCENILNLKYLFITNSNEAYNLFRNKWRKYRRGYKKTKEFVMTWIG